jgi:disulfide bond formation protein DsbB
MEGPVLTPRPAIPVRVGLTFCAAVAAGALGFGMVAQLVWHMRPCPWCTLQRLIYALILLSSLAGVAIHWRGARLGISCSVILLAAAGVAAAAWQSFGPVDAGGCALTLADRIVQATGLDVRLPKIFSATANCDEANVPLMGIPFAIWSLLTYAIIGAVMAFVTWSGWPSSVADEP